MLEEIKCYVDAGIALLDEKGPKDWRDKLDLSTLDVVDPQKCILKQIYGRYGIGCDVLGILHSYQYGFEVPLRHEFRAYATALQAEWVRRLTP
jgi:hypothetical protein